MLRVRGPAVPAGNWETGWVARGKLRSVRYDLEAAVFVARIVANAGGSIGPELLAPALGYSGTNNGTYLTRLANARLFGVVGGRGSRIELTERGRRILAGDEPAASAARREAFLAVPLYRAVVDAAPRGVLPSRLELAERLCEQFGESSEKASQTAAKLLDSARQAGVVQARQGRSNRAKSLVSRFTTVDNFATASRRRRVVSSGSANPGAAASSTSGGRGADMDSGDLWLDEEPDDRPRDPWLRQHAALATAIAVCAIVVALPVSLVVAGGSPARHPQANRHTPHLGNGPAEHQVLSALSATTDSGSFDFTYSLSTTPPTSGSSTTTTTECQTFNVVEPSSSPAYGVSVPPAEVPIGNETITKCSGGPVSNSGTPTSGSGVFDTSPLAMLVDATVGNNLTVTVRVDSTDIYEDLGPLVTSLAPTTSEANETGQAISGFASLTEGTLGTREGAVAMLGMANPMGYLDLYQTDITGADQMGTGTVQGVPVTIYDTSIDPSALVGAPGLSDEESNTISSAIAVLNNQGYTGTDVEVSVDASGFIREAKAVTHFSDGATVVLDTTLSNFGCAGTVLMPGQQGSSTPPSNCTSPDTGQPSANTPNSSGTTSPPTSSTTTSLPTTTTTLGSTTTTTSTPTTTSTTIASTTSTTT